MRRGDLVIASLAGDYGKPRPALIIQADAFASTGSLTILPVTSELMNTPLTRITIQPSASNGLRKESQIMVDKITTTRRERLGSVIGRVDNDVMIAVDRSLAVFLGFA
jgi:mRNA interferase MazF